METFLLISAIIITLIVLIKMHRFNHNLARYMVTETKVYSGGQPLFLMNTAGKWLTFAGGIATGPLVMALIFSPNGSHHWIISTGAMGLATLLVATLLLTFVLTKHCLKRKLDIKRVVSSQYHQLLNKAKRLNWIKVASWMTGVAILITFLPFFVELFNALVFVVGFVIAARLGLFDHVGNEDFNNIDYVQEGIDYDFYYGTNEYNSFPDD